MQSLAGAGREGEEKGRKGGREGQGERSESEIGARTDTAATDIAADVSGRQGQGERE